MPATVYSAATIGLDGMLVEVETDVLQAGLHAFTLVGLPDTAIRESLNGGALSFKIESGAPEKARRARNVAASATRGSFTLPWEIELSASCNDLAS